MVTALFTTAIAGFSTASAQTQPASASHLVGITYDNCSQSVVTIFTPGGPKRVVKGQTIEFDVPFSTHERRIFWSCGYTPEATWLPRFTNHVKVRRQLPSQGRRITWYGFFVY